MFKRGNHRKILIKCLRMHKLLFIIILLLSFQVIPNVLPGEVIIAREWSLPAVLKSISAIDYISQNRMACLQDEVGSIFILNLDSNAIEKEYPFGPPGNYKGLVILNNDAYVACADGRIIEIKNYNSEKRVATEYGT